MREHKEKGPSLGVPPVGLPRESRSTRASVSRRRLRAVRSTEWVADFSLLEPIIWRWWTRPGSSRFASECEATCLSPGWPSRPSGARDGGPDFPQMDPTDQLVAPNRRFPAGRLTCSSAPLWRAKRSPVRTSFAANRPPSPDPPVVAATIPLIAIARTGRLRPCLDSAVKAQNQTIFFRCRGIPSMSSSRWPIEIDMATPSCKTSLNGRADVSV